MKTLIWLALAASVMVFAVNAWRTAQWLRVAAGRERLESIAVLPGVLGLGALLPGQ